MVNDLEFVKTKFHK